MEPGSSNNGYWTDASSLDALSTCSDAEDANAKPSVPCSSVTRNALFSPTGSVYSAASVACTPINPSSSHSYVPPRKAVLVGDALEQNAELLAALKKMDIEYVSASETSFNLTNVEMTTTIVVFEDFCGALFDSLRKKSGKLRIYGVPAIVETACLTPTSSGEPPSLPTSKSGYPIYSRMLRHCRVSVTGICTRDELCDIRRKILYLDGIFVERDGPPTHLIAAKCRGNKYRDAVALDKPILKPDWIKFLWQNRNERSFDISKTIPNYRVRAFYGLRIALEGFDDNEKDKIFKLILDNEGQFVHLNDPSATHIIRGNEVKLTTNLDVTVIPNSLTPKLKEDILATKDDGRSPMKRARYETTVINDINETEAASTNLIRDYSAERAKVLKAEWFWSSIQIEACADEEAYLFSKNYNDETLNNSMDAHTSFTSPPITYSDTDGGTPVSGTPGTTSKRKRKRIRDLFSSFPQGPDVEPKCIMEVDEDSENAELQSKSCDLAGDEVSDVQLDHVFKRIEKMLNSQELRSKLIASRRLQEFSHLVETERNYVNILQNILKLFKEPCEQEDQKAGRILTPLEVKTIFGPIIPIYSLHRRILRDMIKVLEVWTEESLTGQIYVKYAEDLRKCYEPFVEYFETVKNEIVRCESENARFLAFLRIAQCKPQCGKEKLVELIIRPVQRLPSTALILKNLEKHTSATNPDSEWITKGVEAIDRVNQTINQKKERADARVAMFNVFNEIEACPVECISDHRTLLKKYDVMSMNDALGPKNEALSLIVFSDHFQIVKRRNLPGGKHMSSAMSLANLRSPAVSRKSFMHHSSSVAHQKKYKFVVWIDFCHVKKIVDISDMEPKSFAFIVREPDERCERFMMFTVPEDSDLEKTSKISVVEFFAKQVAQSMTRLEYEQFITVVDAKAVKGYKNLSQSTSMKETAVRLKNKVGRALSLSRTPSKIKRTMSQMMSPFSSSKSCPKDPDSVSQSSSDYSITPMRQNLSTMSLWKFGSKRGTFDGSSTPKSRKPLPSKEAAAGCPSIQEM